MTGRISQLSVRSRVHSLSHKSGEYRLYLPWILAGTLQTAFLFAVISPAAAQGQLCSNDHISSAGGCPDNFDNKVQAIQHCYQQLISDPNVPDQTKFNEAQKLQDELDRLDREGCCSATPPDIVSVVKLPAPKPIKSGCGDGDILENEECDPPTVNNPNPKDRTSFACEFKYGPPKTECSTNCQCTQSIATLLPILPVCGDNKIEGLEKCDPPTTGASTDCADGRACSKYCTCVKPIDKCCACQYQDVPSCAKLDGDQGGDKDKCIWSRHPPHGLRECVWDADSNKCKGRFLSFCEKWIKQQVGQNKCTETRLKPRGKNVLEGLRCDRELYSMDDGHGQGCGHLYQKVSLCVAAAGPDCAITHVDEGCSTFKDLNEAQNYMEFIRGGLEPGQSFTAKAHQGLASDACTSYVTYEGSGQCKKVKRTLILCSELEGKFCYKVGEKPVLCRDDKGDEIEATCCFSSCNPIKRAWARGKRCAIERCEGKCNGYSDSMFGCFDAQNSAVGQVLACLDKAKKECGESNAGFKSYAPRTQQRKKWLSCLYNRTDDWSCEK